jgi:predicted TIM-barrel fold metal-dependent hydrolase
MIIDVFCHIVPPKFKAALDKTIGQVDMVDTLPTMYDMDERFRIMDKTEGLMQVLTTSLPPLETIPDKKKALALAKMANDEMAELVLKHPDRFAAAIAALQMNDVDAALKEADRAIKDLKFRGVQIFTPINDKPLDSPEFLPLYEKMAQYNLPILIHPHRDDDFADFGEMRLHGNIKQHLRKPVVNYLKMFYVDTAIYGNTPGLMCSYALYGASHMLFATDFPYDTQWGLRHNRATIESVQNMDINAAEKKMIFEGNARSLLRLPV